VVYSGTVEDKVLIFGVSGRLYKSNLLIYDQQTESLWSRLKGTAIAGPMVGRKLKKITAERTTWKESRHCFFKQSLLQNETCGSAPMA
jgi:hypothetical protein